MPGRIWTLAVVLLVGCASTAKIPDGVEFRSENWFRAAESGFVVAPTSAVHVVEDAGIASADFTNHFYPALLTTLPGTELISPDLTLYRLESGDREGLHHFVAVRSSLAEGLEPDAQTLVALSRDLEHRYLLVSWLEESISEGIDDTAYDDYTTVQHGEEVRRYAYEKVDGRARAVVLDLWEDEVLWRGSVEYQTAQLYGSDGSIRGELERARGAAAIRLAECLGQI
jgi:hypothetical protein